MPLALPRRISRSKNNQGIYVTNCLRIMTENTAKQVGGNYITAEYEDLIHPKKKDNRTGNEIAADVIRNAGIKVV